MMEISSEPQDVFEFMKKRKPQFVTLDIETLDSKSLKLWNEPIVSFALTFIHPANSVENLDLPTFCYSITNTKKEYDLLVRLKDIFSKFPEDTTIVGHNIAHMLRCKSLEGWKNTDGYDLPKISRRGEIYGLDMSIFKEFNIYDTLQEAYDKLDHTKHGFTYKDKYTGTPKVKKILSSEELESILNIRRPERLPKLGQQVRDYFEKERYSEIMLYNCSDTIVESLFYYIFESQGYMSRNRSTIRVDQIPVWGRLISNIKKSG